MTGGQTSTREKLGSIFFAVVMVTSMVAMSAAFAGGAAAQAPGTDTTLIEGDGQTVIDGSANQSLNRIGIQDDLGGALGGGDTTIVLPDGVTVNESQSDLVAFTNSSNLEVTGTSVSADGSEITVTHTSNSQVDDVLRVRNIVVDVAPDTVATDASTLGLTAETQAGTENYSPVFTVDKATLGGGGSSVALGGSGETFSLGPITAKDVDAIGNQTTLTLQANESNGITFDESVDPTNVVSGTTGAIAVDSGNVEVSATEITIPITNEPTDPSDAINFDDASVNVTGSAQAFKLTATAEATESTGAYTVDNSGFSEVSVNGPSTTVDFDGAPNDISTAKDQQPLTTDSDDEIVVDAAADEIGAGTNVTITFNNTEGVSFDAASANPVDGSSDGFGDGNGASLDPVQVNENNITVRVTGDSGVTLDGNDQIEFDGVTVNTTEDTAGDYNVVGQIQSSSSATVLDVEGSETLSIVEPSAAFGSDQEVFVDNDGVEGVSLSSITVSDNAGNVQIDSSENATISLPANSGVTFDKSAAADGSVSAATVTDSEIEVDLGTTDGTFTVDDGSGNLNFNVSSDADAVVQPTATVFTGTQNVTFDLDDQINVTQATVSDVTNEGITNSGTTTVNTEETATVGAANASVTGTPPNFGDADIDLNLTSQPSSTNLTTSDVLNTTSVTTAADGQADFNFSSASSGSYEITASSATDENVNATFDFTVNSGNIAQVDVEGVENALRGGAADGNENLQTGVYEVSVTDSEGNLATTDEEFEVRLLTSGDTSELIAVSDNLADDGTTGNANAASSLGGGSTGPFETTSGSNIINYNPDQDTSNEVGVFYVYVGNDLAQDVDLKVVPRGSFSDVNTASGTTTFYSGVDSVTLDTTETLSTGDNATATATAATADGTQIAVPRLGDGSGSAFSTDDSSVVEIVNQSTTDATGEATANLSAAQAGTANITADLNGVTDSTEITVEGLDYEITNVTLDPNNVTANTTVDHDLLYTVTNASSDGNTDTYTVTLPASASFENAGNSLTVTDATGQTISTTSGPSIGDANNGTNNQLTFDVAPDSNFDTSAVNVDANVSVSFPDVSSSTTEDITLNVSDSSQGTTNASTPVTIEPAVTAPSPVVENGSAPTDIDGDGTFEDVNGDGNLNIGDVQAIFQNRDSSAVQNNTAAFDYNGDGVVNIGDVQALFQDSQAA